ncbi:MAG: hypothetical protein U0263_37580 [Polyangiaceae bacterium]
MGAILGILDVLDVFLSLAALAAGIVTAVRCGQKRLSTTGAWVLSAALCLSLVVSAGFAFSNLVLVRALPPSGFSIYRIVLLLMQALNVVAWIGVVIGIGLLKPVVAEPEVAHG